MSILVDREVFELPRSSEADVEIFAIGDIHGRADLLAALLDEAAREPRRAARRAMVFLGDLIDRGPDSLGAVELAIDSGARLDAQIIGLLGNHEIMMRLALDPATAPGDALEALHAWARNGGSKVIAQFPAMGPNMGARLGAMPSEPEAFLKAIRAAAPPRITAWLEGLRSHWRSGEILFVHAGVNPRCELEAFLATPWNTPLRLIEEDRNWAWVRWPFLEHDPGPEGWSGLFVVHGHTPRDAKPHASHADQIDRFRLNLDAGSAMSGVAEMAIIRGARAEVIAARAP